MFDNPGTKIKGLAKTFFWIEVVALVLVFLAMGDMLFEEVAILIGGLIGLAVGIGVAYISALFLAAFGELVESNTAIKENSALILQKLNTSLDASKAPAHRTQNTVCPGCGTTVTPEQNFCPGCGNKM